MNAQLAAAEILRHIGLTGWIDNNIATAIAYSIDPALVVSPAHLRKDVKEFLYQFSNEQVVWSQGMQWWRPRNSTDRLGRIQN